MRMKESVGLISEVWIFSGSLNVTKPSIMMIRSTAVSLAVAAGAISTSFAQVPQVIHYQGKIQSGSTNFSGSGRFKFSLVDKNGTTTFWSHDGTGNAGGEPAGQVEVPVLNGLYSVALGDTALPGMSAIPYSVFGNTGVGLRVWFNDGIHGFQQLSPDQTVSAVGYAMMAANVRDGAIGTAQIANGAITADKLAGGGLYPGGGLVASPSYLDPALTAAGYSVFGGPNLHGNQWTKYSSTGQPSARTTPPQGAVWTGTEMIFWGDTANPGGGRYNPQTGQWTALLGSATNSPGPRSNYTTVWTGEEMIIWGGSNASVNSSTFGTPLRSGSRYNPATGQWTLMRDPADDIPGFSAREFHTAVWTGHDMIVWDGIGSGTEYNTGARYNPDSDTWLPVAQDVHTPAARCTHASVWTGTQMIIWAGGSAYYDGGGRYDPVTNTWTPMASTSSIGLAGRNYPEAVWTGAEMIVWGGYRSGHTHMSDGARYNPGNDTWTILPSSNLGGRYGHRMAWTGRELLLYGGRTLGSPYGDGASYDPIANTWSSMSTDGAPPARAYFPSVWTGRELLACSFTGSADIYGYAPRRTYYFYQKP